LQEKPETRGTPCKGLAHAKAGRALAHSRIRALPVINLKKPSWGSAFPRNAKGGADIQTANFPYSPLQSLLHLVGCDDPGRLSVRDPEGQRLRVVILDQFLAILYGQNEEGG